MRACFSWILLIVFPPAGTAQLMGNTFVYSRTDSTRVCIQLHNDSVLSFVSFGKASPAAEFFEYAVDEEGTVHYCALQDSSYNPVTKLYRSETLPPGLLSKPLADQRFFVLNTYDPRYNMDARWKVYFRDSFLASGYGNDKLGIAHLGGPGPAFSLEVFDRYFDRAYLLSQADFDGTGDYYLLETSLPFLFFGEYITVKRPGTENDRFPLRLSGGRLYNALTGAACEAY